MTSRKNGKSPAAILAGMRQDIETELGSLRAQISETRQALELAANGPLPKDEWIGNIHTWIAQQANAFAGGVVHTISDARSPGTPSRLISFAHMPVAGAHAPGAVAETNLAGLLCWLMPEAIEQKLSALIEASDYQPGPASSERPALIRELRQRLDTLERAEEQLICAAEDADILITRRIDARPEVVLALPQEAAA